MNQPISTPTEYFSGVTGTDPLREAVERLISCMDFSDLSDAELESVMGSPGSHPMVKKKAETIIFAREALRGDSDLRDKLGKQTEALTCVRSALSQLCSAIALVSEDNLDALRAVRLTRVNLERKFKEVTK